MKKALKALKKKVGSEFIANSINNSANKLCCDICDSKLWKTFSNGSSILSNSCNNNNNNNNNELEVSKELYILLSILN